MKKSPVLALPILALILAACGSQDNAAQDTASAPQETAVLSETQDANVAAVVTVDDAWCRPTPNGAKAGGCYVILTSNVDDTLTGVTSDLADLTQVHEMKHEDGMMKMSHLDQGLALRAGMPTELKPHGNHIMLMGLKAPLVNGQSAKITLNFAKAEDVSVEFAIRTPPVVGGEE